MSDSLTIITNNVPRDIIYPEELTDKERAEFDYIDFDAEPNRNFVRYKGEVIDLHDLELPYFEMFPGWHSYRSDSFFSGILFRFVGDEMDQVICGRYYS